MNERLEKRLREIKDNKPRVWVPSFKFSEDQAKALNEWNKEHKKECKYTKKITDTVFVDVCGCIGGRLSYEFTPTGLGIVTTAKCACGYELDLTDYDLW